MILGFSTAWPKEMGEWAGMPTEFPQKIWSCFRHMEITKELGNFLYSKYSTGKNILDLYPKLHTIREDAGNRWKVGNNIHFYINVRKKDMFQFAPVVKVKSIQTIEIIQSGESWRMPWVMIDGVIQTAVEIEKLAINDGFESTEQFFAWFSKGFTGKIIHWTDLKY